MPLISVTRLRIRSPWYLPQFFCFTLLSLLQAKRAQGHLRSTTLRDADRVFWTLSAWTDEGAMRAYMLSGAHRKAMPKLLDWCDEAAVAHWNQTGDELPDWHEAHRQLQSKGRPSKVHHPNPRHTAREFGTPRF